MLVWDDLALRDMTCFYEAAGLEDWGNKPTLARLSSPAILYPYKYHLTVRDREITRPANAVLPTSF